MSQWQKVLDRILNGNCDQNINFDNLCTLLERLGFRKRQEGSHHVFTRADIIEIIDIQPRKDGKAKDYQVRQLRGILKKYHITQA
jgi:predicted RNA binding protein YcfA (HicA-like mRNA interferase family)